MNEINHEMCSELLRPYLAGELDAPQEQRVADHLGACPECSRELQVVRGLLSPTEAPLTEMERADLARAVRLALAPAQRESWWDRLGRRAAPAMGAAALLAIVAVAVVSMNDTSPQTADVATGQSDEAEADAQNGSGDAAAPGAEPKAVEGTTSGDADRLQDETAQDTARSEMAASSGGGAGDGADVGDPSGKAVGTTLSGLTPVITEDSFATASFSRASLVPVRSAYRRDASGGLRALVKSAPNRAIADLIDRCARRALETSPHPLVPSYATYFRGDDVLVIAFVWVERPSRDLSYELRGWRERSCEAPSPIYRRGRLP